jgi:hypothetical protein
VPYNCVVHQNIDPSESLTALCNHAIDLIGVGQIRIAVYRSNAVLLFDRCSLGVDLAQIAKTVDHDIATGGRESFRSGQAESLRRSSDERALPLKHCPL